MGGGRGVLITLTEEGREQTSGPKKKGRKTSPLPGRRERKERGALL